MLLFYVCGGDIHYFFLKRQIIGETMLKSLHIYFIYQYRNYFLKIIK